MVSDSKGILLGLAAAVLYTSVVLISKHLKDIDGVNVSLVQLATASIVLIPYVLIIEDTSSVEFTPLNISMLLIIGIIHTGIAYALYYSCLKDLKSQTVALYSYIDPVVSVFLAVIILNEHMSLVKLSGAILILGAAMVNEFYPHTPQNRE
jgi:drug/metabolite transporter (DMT)-like permease